MVEMDELLDLVVTEGVSDLHIEVGVPPVIRLHGEMTQRQLAEHTHVTAATISGTLKRMERAGLVYRTDDEKDARVSIVRLTEDGKELGKQASELFARTDVSMLEGFSDEECDMLLGFLGRMRDNVCRSLCALNESGNKNETK